MPGYTVLRSNTLINRRTRTEGEVIDLDTETGDALAEAGYVAPGRRTEADRPDATAGENKPEPRERTVTRKG